VLNGKSDRIQEHSDAATCDVALNIYSKSTKTIFTLHTVGMEMALLWKVVGKDRDRRRRDLPSRSEGRIVSLPSQSVYAPSSIKSHLRFANRRICAHASIRATNLESLNARLKRHFNAFSNAALAKAAAPCAVRCAIDFF
jgi:hypothetical protein